MDNCPSNNCPICDELLEIERIRSEWNGFGYSCEQFKYECHHGHYSRDRKYTTSFDETVWIIDGIILSHTIGPDGTRSAVSFTVAEAIALAKKKWKESQQHTLYSSWEVQWVEL